MTSEERGGLTRNIIVFLSLLFLVSLPGGLLGYVLYHPFKSLPAGTIFEYGSTVCGYAAAVFAGGGLLWRERERAFFVAALVLIVGSFICFLLKLDAPAIVLYMQVLAMALALACVFVWRVVENAPMSWRTYVLLLFAYILIFTIMYFVVNV